MNNTFGKNIVPANEELRIRAYHHYNNLLSDLPGNYFNNIAHIIARTFDAPIALVSLVGEHSVFFKGNAGMEGVESTDRGISLCSLAVLEGTPTIFTDALEEPCLLSNPLVIGDFGLRFYAGAPVTTREGFNIGTVCIVAREPRNFTDNERDLLINFADSVMHDLESRQQFRQDAHSEIN
jgi:GAF domain-containing protein